MLLKRSTIKCLANQCLMIQSEVIITPHNWPKYPIPPPCRFKNVINDRCAEDSASGTEEVRTAPFVRTIFSRLGVYTFVNFAFLSRKNTKRFGISTLNCPLVLAALFPSGKSRISPTAQIEGCDSSCSVGRTFTKPPGESDVGPRASDIQAVFGLGPYVGTYETCSRGWSATSKG